MGWSLIEAEARLEVVRKNIEVWNQRRKAYRGYPPGPRLVGIDENNLYEAQRKLKGARRLLQFATGKLKGGFAQSDLHAQWRGVTVRLTPTPDREQVRLGVEFFEEQVKNAEKEVEKREREMKQVELEIVSKVRNTDSRRTMERKSGARDIRCR